MADFPYTVVPKSIRPFFNHIQGAGVPQKVTQQYLVATGFKSTNDRQIIGVLKAIDFIDSAGTPTENWRKFRSKSSGAAVLAAAIKKCYKSLFETYPDANTRPNNTLRDFISSHSSAGERMLDAMVGTFKALCDVAAFSNTTDDADPDSGGDIEHLDDVLDGKPKGKLRHQHDSGGAQIIINIQLVVPTTDDPVIYDSFFEAMKRHLIKPNE